MAQPPQGRFGQPNFQPGPGTFNPNGPTMQMNRGPFMPPQGGMPVAPMANYAGRN
jgi:hypothetical protein